MTKTRKLLYVLPLLVIISAIVTGPSVSRASLGMDDDVTKVKETIYAYFTLRYDALKANKPYADYSPVIDDLENCSTEWLQMESDIRALRHFIHSIYEVTIIDYRFQLDFESIQVDGNEAVVKLRESNEIYYKRRPTEPSKLANIEHKIWLRKTENGWLITNDKYSDDFTRLLDGSSLEVLFENVRRNHGHQRGDMIAEDINPPNPPESTSASGMQYYDEYDSTAAVDYADTNYDRTVSLGSVPQMLLDREDWNPGWDETYKDYGDTDCTNFIAQSVFEGIAFTASDPNYFYPDPANYNEWWYYKFSDLADGSKPWISVREFREFLIELNETNGQKHGAS
ncbi:amidase domain-containing protein [Chloroflexota bacterium]